LGGLGINSEGEEKREWKGFEAAPAVFTVKEGEGGENGAFPP